MNKELIETVDRKKAVDVLIRKHKFEIKQLEEKIKELEKTSKNLDEKIKNLTYKKLF